MTTSSGAENPAAEPGPRNVLFDVWLASRATTAIVDRAIRASGLNADEFAVYSVLASTEGMPPTELARWMSAPPTTVSSYIARFVRRGHAVRVPHPEDARSHVVQLTDAGRAAHLAAGRLFLPVLEDVGRRLGPELEPTRERLLALHSLLVGLASHAGSRADDSTSGSPGVDS